MIKFVILLYIACFITCRPNTRKLSEETKRMLDGVTVNTSGSWEPLRIRFEYVTDADAETTTFLNQIFSIAGTFFQKHLLIRRSATKLALPSTAVADFQDFLVLPSEFLTVQYEEDLVFFVTTMNNSTDTTLAACAPVVFDPNTKRPTFGMIQWNMAYTDVATLTNAGYEAQLATAIHEIIHGLGFISDLFKQFYDSVDGTVYADGGSRTVNDIIMVTTPRVVAQAQKHFGCTDISGVPMEQEGGGGTAGSHWERALFYNEMMTGSDMIGDFILSDFTLQLLQDTGFYRLATYNPDILTWGYNEGCSFYSDQCQGTFKEFCTQVGAKGCAITHNGIGNCATDSLSNSCQYVQIDPALDCRNQNSVGYSDNTATYQYFGFESMCVSGGFSSQSSTPQDFSCYQFQCGDKFIIKVDGQTIDCTSGGSQTLTGYTGSITCPDDFKLFCDNKDECPNQCNKRGFCMKGLCTCIGSYYGAGCELEGCATARSGKECVTSCASGEFHNTDINYCIGCPGNCATCSSYNVCTQCNSGYQLRGGFCDYLLTGASNRQLLFILMLVWLSFLV